MVTTGLEVFISGSDFVNKKTALLANHTSLTKNFSYSWQELVKSKKELVKIFSPEHGLFGEEQDQLASDTGSIDGIPVTSLYGMSEASLSPTAEQFADIDTIIYDIQDIGTRYYTYAATLILFMQAINTSNKELIVLDRPNPLGGTAIEGPMLKAEYGSFVGITPVPVRHGLTVGEIALWAKQYFKIDLNLQIIKMQGWQRSMYYESTGLPWVPPSPNMPTLSAALIYPGMCLLEGTNISEGRGTTRPFEIFGAPFLDTEKFLKHEAIRALQGIVFVPFMFRPTFNKFKGEICRGFFIHVTNRDVLEPFKIGVAIVKALHDECPEFEFLHNVYEFNSTHPAFDLLCGSSQIREMIISNKSMSDISASWRDEQQEFAQNIKDFHLY